MRHNVAHRKLGRVTEHRLALLRNQAIALLRHEKIETTVPKAKELRPFVERLITIARRGVAAGAGAVRPAPPALTRPHAARPRSRPKALPDSASLCAAHSQRPSRRTHVNESAASSETGLHIVPAACVNHVRLLGCWCGAGVRSASPTLGVPCADNVFSRVSGVRLPGRQRNAAS